MKILVTGANGFVGKNLVCTLKTKEEYEVLPYDVDTGIEKLEEYVKECDFVAHLAGVNRPKNADEFTSGNTDFTKQLIEMLDNAGNRCPIAMTSSIQAALDNPYGKSKRAAEDILFSRGNAFVYRLPNVFGKWCRPNYNSAVATFCHNISRDLPITVTDPSIELTLVYIDDVVNELLNAINGKANICEDGFCRVPVTHKATLGHITELLCKFKNSRVDLSVPDMEDEFEKKLYSTYLSALEPDNFSYPLNMHCDDRGSFTEIIRTLGNGQFSVNISKPGITKGNHWHHTKNEKFLVVSGHGIIRFRKVGESQVFEYDVCGENLKVVDIPPGYTHNIENIGDGDMVTFMWANEPFNPDKPDTFFLKV